MEPEPNVPLNNQSLTNSNRQQHKWKDPSFLDCGIRFEQQFSDFNQSSEAQTSFSCNSTNQNQRIGAQENQMKEGQESRKIQDWDPRTMLNNLSFLEKKIHQLQDLVHVIDRRRDQDMGRPDELMFQQQQLITVDLTSTIVQLISTAGSLLPSVKHNLSSVSPVEQFGRTTNSSGEVFGDVVLQQYNPISKAENQSNQTPIDVTGYSGVEQNSITEDLELKIDDDADEGEILPPGSYEILQLEKEEILALHTHFCTICGKGFKRDANLRMHMRGHGDEYKTPAALAKPGKETSSEPILIKRYSCPYVGCKRNKDHKKFQPLKSILCVRNHYKRTHCDKTYSCIRCNTKKFSVIADLKTHEKHCGREKWLCSCGTTFSRKDKLFGHIALFQGHTPAIPVDEFKGSARPSDQGQKCEAANNVDLIKFKSNAMDAKGSGNDPTSYFTPITFGASSVGGFNEFP
ncbi:Protein SENSITIVE TO PROTON RHIZOTOXICITY 1 [Forsythia ovata]|uniref:Protein SENSITIVE TO PROTON RHIZOTOXICITY 1 n=1 Tax=Forsythia ovata TaxID=205694 RepID=A0ABD1PUQ0_9LAMI